MIVLSKKRIIYILFVIIIALCYLFIKNHSEETILVSSLPVSNHTIILDAGHGNPDGGAESSAGVTEQEINLEIVIKLQELLEQSGSIVVLTRSDENGIYDTDKETIREKKVSDMKNRVEIGNESEGEIFVSIHLNKIPQEQ